MTRTARTAAAAALAALAAIVAIACTGSDPTPPDAATPSVAQKQSEDTAPSVAQEQSVATSPSATESNTAAQQQTTTRTGVVDIRAAKDYTCAIRASDGAIVCWGLNGHFRSSDGRFQETGKTEPPAGSFTAISGSSWYACAIRSLIGEIECWPGNWKFSRNSPPAGSFTAVATGRDHACAIRADSGQIECWGFYTESGYLLPDKSWLDAPAGRFSTIVAGGFHMCAIRESNGEIECWGGFGGSASAAPSGSFTAISSTGDDTCAIRASDGGIECWGEHGTHTEPSNNLPPPGEFHAVSVGGKHGCAIRTSDDGIECWGFKYQWNAYGQADPPAGSYTAVAAGWHHTCAASDTGIITCWGWNKFGQLDGPTAPPDQPTISQTGQLTIDEYAIWCNAYRYGAVTPDTTWAEAAALLTETIAEFERVAERLPPEQGLAEYHEVMTDALRIMQSAARMDDIAGSVADLFNRDLLNLFNIPEMLELAVRVGIALEGLTPSTRAKLGGGCI